VESLDRARREFAEKIRATAGLRSETLVRAFGSVPREDFVGLGPWNVLRPQDVRRYEATRPYSALSAIIGSSRVARRAGR
jgi:protein-L-isoaspartate O-methyltransferase